MRMGLGGERHKACLLSGGFPTLQESASRFVQYQQELTATRGGSLYEVLPLSAQLSGCCGLVSGSRLLEA